jgi:hypothetical protein
MRVTQGGEVSKEVCGGGGGITHRKEQENFDIHIKELSKDPGQLLHTYSMMEYLPHPRTWANIRGRY